MPSTSKAQQTAMRMALAARKGDLPVSKLKGSALDIYKSDMTDKQIEDFTVLKEMVNLKDFLNESLLSKAGVNGKLEGVVKRVTEYLHAKSSRSASFQGDFPSAADFELLSKAKVPIWVPDFGGGDTEFDRYWWPTEFGMIIRAFVKHAGPNCSLNWIDMSKVKRLNAVFMNSDFNGDISKWDVSNVENMSQLFRGSKFNGDISKWDVRKLKAADYMFAGSKFNGDISKWKTDSLDSTISMFEGSDFNGDISGWDMSKVRFTIAMFKHCKFNRDISNWELKSLKACNVMFADNPKFNQDLSSWDISNIPEQHKYNMFYRCPIPEKNVPKGTE